MSARRSLKNIILALCTTSLSLTVIGCSSGGQSPQTTEAIQPSSVASKISTLTLSKQDKAISRYEHIFVIIEENKAYSQIIGNPNAPIVNQLAKTYGLASQFYGEVHSSEGNYIAMLGGSTFGVHDDDAFYCQTGSSDRFCSSSGEAGYVNHTIAARSLLDQLEQKGLTWKGYFEDIPASDLKAIVFPDATRALYAAKHNGFVSFKKVQGDPDLSRKLVGIGQLTADLKSGKVPNYSHIVFNQCHEMHGLSECRNLQQLIQVGDTMIGGVVSQITHSKLWSSRGNNAIVVTWDEDNNPLAKTGTQGCCDYDPNSPANFGGGHIPTIVITNHGPRGVVDSTPYNHNSLLRTTEDAFGIHEYLGEAGNTDKGVKPMTPLFAK